MDDDTEGVDPAILAEADLERRQSGAIHALLKRFSGAAIVTRDAYHLVRDVLRKKEKPVPTQ